MHLDDLISPERVLPDVRASSKKRLLEIISQALADSDNQDDSRNVFESLCARERLGSTGLGNGVAIPHGRISGSSGVRAIFVRLAKPLDFDSVDGMPVDLLFALAVPENCNSEHLKLLAEIAEKFSDKDLVEKLRKARDSASLVQLLLPTHH